MTLALLRLYFNKWRARNPSSANQRNQGEQITTKGIRALLNFEF